MAPQFSEPSRLDAAWNSIRRWLPVVMTAGTASLATAQGPASPLPPMEPKPVVAPKVGDTTKPADAKIEKLYEVKFDGTDWSKIIDWLEKETGLMCITKDKPQGSITLKPNKKYTLGELIDLLNERLEQDNFIILRKSQTFSFYAADQKVPLVHTPNVTREDLMLRGKTEFVQHIIPLVTLQADDVRDQVKKTLSPFGEVQSFGTDQLLVRDKAAYVRNVLMVIDEIIKNKNDQLNHTCKFKRASYVAETLRTLLKDNTTDTTSNANPNMQFGGGGWNGGGWNGGAPATPAARTDTRRFRTVNITVDDANNNINITGPADKIIAAKDLVKELDKGDKERPLPGKAEWVTYNVATGTAEALAKQLMANRYYMNSSVQAMSVGTSQIYVYAYTTDHLEISQILKIPPVTTPVEVKTVNVAGSVDLEKLVANIKSAVPGVTADAKLDGEPGLVLRGAPELVKAAEDYIAATVPKATPSTGTDKFRSITLPNGNSAAMAEHLSEMLKKMGRNAVVVDPNKTERRPEPAPASPSTGGPVQKIGQSNSPAPLYANVNVRQVRAQIVDPQAAPKKPDIIFSVIGNKLVITGDDPKDVQLAYEMLQLFTNTSSKPEERSDIIRLKSISADDAAKVLNEVFNGPAAGAQGAAPGGRGGGGGGGIGALFNPAQLLGGLVGGGSAPTDPKAGRIRVVSEKSSNSLIVVRASELDMITIRYLLRNTMESDLPPEGGIAKTYTIPLKNARASEVVATLRTVFSNETGGGRRGNQQPTPFNPFVPQQPQATSTAALTVDYDVESNRVVCKCTEPLYQEVRALCETLDVATKESNEITEVIQLKGVAPSTVQQIIETLQGKTPTTQAGTFAGQGRTGQGGAGFGGAGGGGNPFGGGGFGGAGGGNPFGGGGAGGGRGFGGGGAGGGGNPFGGGGAGGGGRGGAGGGGRGGAAGGGGRTQRMEDRISFDGGGGGQRPFDDAGMDAPSLIFDPEVDGGFYYEGQNTRMPSYGPREVSPILQAAYLEPAYAPNTLILAQAPMGPGALAQPPRPMPMPTQPPKPMGNPMGVPSTTGALPPNVGTQLNVQTPSNDTTVFSIDGQGLLVIRARNKEEIENIKRIIEALSTGTTGFLKETEVAVEIIPIKRADANVVLTEVQQLFSRLQVSAGAITFPQIQQQRNQGGFGGGGFPFGGQAFGVQNQGQTVGTLVLFPIPRLNSILVAVPKNSLEIVKKYITELDVGISTTLQPVRYPLNRAAATIVQRQILDLFNNRFPGDTSDKIRVTVDTANNALLVQAGPSDQEDIARLIKLLDADTSDGPTNDVKVFRLKNALADELTNVIANTLTANIVNPQTSTVSAGGTGTGAGGLNQVGGAGGQLQNNQFATGGGGNLGGQFGGAGGLNAQANRTTGLSTKTNALRFNSQLGTYESGLLEDVHITPDLRINAVVVTAPTKTMKLIEAIITELDGVAAAKSYVNIFQLKKADATAVQTLLIQLFSRQQTTGGGQAGGLGGLGGFGAAAGQQGNRPLLTLTGNPSDGAALIDLRLTADARTNSLIVAGSQNDLELVRAVIAKLEDTYNVQFASDVVKIRNAAAADVSTAVLTFLQQQVTQVNAAQFSTATNPFNGIQRQVFIQPEPVTNQLLISATPQMLPEIKRLIAAIDAAPPQVFVEVLIAEVRLNNNEEFGIEVGLQSSVLFARGGATAAVPGTPGYNFNTTSALPNSANVTPGLVGFQGLGNLGVGRNSSTGLNVGGMVLSAANDSFNLLIRALKAQGRVDVLSRPTLMLTDNQTGFFQVGQQFPRITASTLAATGAAQQSVEYINIGVVLRVTPRISPDGTVLMRVEPQISSPSTSLVQLAPGIAATPIDTQTVETTVLAASGETVVLGGLIRKSDTKLENKVPVLGDIPWLGAAFRYRTQQIERREIVFVMTPRIIRSQDDMKRVLAEEARKMSWNIKEAAIVSGLDADIFRGKGADAANCPPSYYNPEVMTGTPLLQPGLPMYMNPSYQPQPFAPGMAQPLTAPTILPQAGTTQVAPATLQPTGAYSTVPMQQQVLVAPAALPQQPLHQPVQPQQPLPVVR